jgi:hypothetical protein
MMSGPRLRGFLRDVDAGAATRSGYRRFTFQWLGQTVTRAQKADLEAAQRLGLLQWAGLIPGAPATLTEAGALLLKGAA